MVYGDIYSPKTAHGVTADAAICRLSYGAILRIHIFHQVAGNICLDILPVIETIAPLAWLSGSHLAIRQNHNEFGYFTERDQRIGRLVSLAAAKPVYVAARRSMQQIKYRI